MVQILIENVIGFINESDLSKAEKSSAIAMLKLFHYGDFSKKLLLTIGEEKLCERAMMVKGLNPSKLRELNPIELFKNGKLKKEVL